MYDEKFSLACLVQSWDAVRVVQLRDLKPAYCLRRQGRSIVTSGISNAALQYEPANENADDYLFTFISECVVRRSSPVTVSTCRHSKGFSLHVSHFRFIIILLCTTALLFETARHTTSVNYFGQNRAYPGSPSAPCRQHG